MWPPRLSGRLQAMKDQPAWRRQRDLLWTHGYPRHVAYDMDSVMHYRDGRVFEQSTGRRQAMDKVINRCSGCDDGEARSS